MSEATIYIDVDGVVCDFVSGICGLMAGRPNDYPNMFDRMIQWPKGEYDLNKAIGYQGELATLSEAFWAALKPTVDAGEIVDTVLKYTDKIIFATKICSSDCLKGKQAWLNRYYPGYPVVYLDNVPKAVLCRDWNAFLLDDSEEECVAWNAVGKVRAITIPRQWNPYHCNTVQRYVDEHLNTYLKAKK